MRLVVPDEGKSDEEVLERTVDLVSREGIAQKRAELQQLVGSIRPGLKDSTVAGEIEDLVIALNKAIMRKRTARERVWVCRSSPPGRTPRLCPCRSYHLPVGQRQQSARP
jgi:hypothetical protein